MKIKQLMYLDKFLEAPEVICVFPVNKKISLQDIRKDVIEKIEEDFNEEAYINAQDAINDLLSGGDVSLEYNNAFYMWFTIDINIPTDHTSSYIRSESIIKYGNTEIMSSRQALEDMFQSIELDYAVHFCEDYSQNTWYINKKDIQFLIRENIIDKYLHLLEIHNLHVDTVVKDLENMLETAETITDTSENEFVIIDWL